MPHNLPPPEVPFAPMGPNVSQQYQPSAWEAEQQKVDANPLTQLGRVVNPIMRNPIDAAENALMLYGAPGALMKLGGAVTKYGPRLAAGGLTLLGGSDEAQSGRASYISKLAGNFLNSMATKMGSRKAKSPQEYNKLSSLNTQLPKGIPRELQIPAENAVLDGANITEVIEAVKKALQYLQKGM